MHFLLVFLLATGCQHDPLTPAQKKTQIQQSQEMTYAGEWSAPVKGLRARIRLSRTQVRESQQLISALELWNASSHSIELNNSAETKFAASSVWTLGNELYLPDSLEVKNLPEKPMRLAPGAKFMIGRAHLRITPSVAPRLGPQPLSASTRVGAERLSAPPAMVIVSPAQWGAASNGLRLCMGTDTPTLEPSSALEAVLYMHNASRENLLLQTLDLDHPQVRSEDDVITLTFRPGQNSSTYTIGPRIVHRRALELGHLLDRPGIYRLRVVVEAPPGIVPKNVWTGSATSNELTIRVETPKNIKIPAANPSTPSQNGG
jgi:hypothetical protein